MLPSRFAVYVIVVLAALALIVGIKTCQGPKTDDEIKAALAAVAAYNRDTAASNALLRKAVSEADSLRKVTEELKDRQARLQRTRTVIAERTDSLADIARTATSLQDSADGWRLAYEARTTERDTLLIELDLANERAAVNLGIATAERIARVELQTRLDRLEATNASVARALRKAQCTIVFGIPCPSRREAAIAGVVTGALIARHVKD